MASRPSLPLDVFISAAAAGPLLWARCTDGQLEVCSGTTPAGVACGEIGRLFVAALRERFGAAASAIAEHEWRLGMRTRRLLPARTVMRAVACAESAWSLLQARDQLMQLEFSAVLLGWRFRRVAEALGLDPAGLSIERRQAVDQILAADFRAPPPADAEALGLRLRGLLGQALH